MTGLVSARCAQEDELANTRVSQWVWRLQSGGFLATRDRTEPHARPRTTRCHWSPLPPAPGSSAG